MFQHFNKTPERRSLISLLFPHSSFYLRAIYGKAPEKKAEMESESDHQSIIIGQSTVKVMKKIKILFLTDYLRDQGMPFNKAGQILLDNIIKALALPPQQAEIEVIKKSSSRPDREFTHKTEDWNRLIDQIYSVQAEYVVTLGAFASNFILQKDQRLTELRGRFYRCFIEHPRQNLSFKILPLFHPDFLVINPSMKMAAWNDLQLILNDKKRSVVK